MCIRDRSYGASGAVFVQASEVSVTSLRVGRGDEVSGVGNPKQTNDRGGQSEAGAMGHSRSLDGTERRSPRSTSCVPRRASMARLHTSDLPKRAPIASGGGSYECCSFSTDESKVTSRGHTGLLVRRPMINWNNKKMHPDISESVIQIPLLLFVNLARAKKLNNLSA